MGTQQTRRVGYCRGAQDRQAFRQGYRGGVPQRKGDQFTCHFVEQVSWLSSYELLASCGYIVNGRTGDRLSHIYPNGILSHQDPHCTS